MLHYGPLCSIRTRPIAALLECMTVLLEYLDLLISDGHAQLRFGGPSPALGYVTEKQTWHLKALLSLESCYSIICPLCPHYARGLPIMLDALACLLCLKLCQHNRRRPSSDINVPPVTAGK